MAAPPCQDHLAQGRRDRPTRAAHGISPAITGPLMFAHLWVILVIVAAIGVLVLSIPLPLYESGLAAIDPSLTGLLDPAT